MAHRMSLAVDAATSLPRTLIFVAFVVASMRATPATTSQTGLRFFTPTLTPFRRPFFPPQTERRLRRNQSRSSSLRSQSQH